MLGLGGRLTLDYFRIHDLDRLNGHVDLAVILRVLIHHFVKLCPGVRQDIGQTEAIIIESASESGEDPRWQAVYSCTHMRAASHILNGGAREPYVRSRVRTILYYIDSRRSNPCKAVNRKGISRGVLEICRLLSIYRDHWTAKTIYALYNHI